MKRPDKELSSKTKFDIFCHLLALILGGNCVKGLIVTKTVQKVKFERA